ncbi:G-type lectin S-receptor-like serine/threonine-protein kinase At1g34300 [Alnus glutinosa]|uniref:G-type lectin S-receptor-like serine/threonine-protein kinase At1g34300 n=1 Tax=Alnus glutinosa TaxID=3517 RepID=UPI002D7820D7|nr:G-type lectin S-receptor-like serine/threonine-protein kinase At1g34300 [Alnus glutinosa]
MSSRTTPGSMGRYTLSQSESASSDLAGGADRRETEIVVVFDTNSLRLREEEEHCWRERLWEVKCKAEFGDNGYCVLIDQKACCKCLPQFEPVNKEDGSSGCRRNSTVESCKSSKGNFTMEPVAPNTVWENKSTYAVLKSPSQANCGEACSQEYCDCEAALFKDGLCAKHKLPLRFVRRNQTDSTLALIKQHHLFTIEIACHISRGLVYLHEECEPQIIHCDIKPQNKLMDENRVPKISDFGLAKLLKVDQSRAFTDIRGTKGYVAPEWFRNLPVTIKVDVYSFGIVLLEIICCRKSVDHNLPKEEAILEQWAYQCFEAGELGKLVNNEEVDKTQLERMAKVGLW